jgi:hypothetical protein
MVYLPRFAARARLVSIETLDDAPRAEGASYRLGIELPITEMWCRVLDGQDLDDLAANLMGREPTRE